MSPGDAHRFGGSDERDAVARAARMLGMDTVALRALQGLVEMERVVDQMRRGLLHAE